MDIGVESRTDGDVSRHTVVSTPSTFIPHFDRRPRLPKEISDPTEDDHEPRGR